ncbi:GTPase IMAP family member 4 [Danio aesculapii]|uniref:GTPase IMAP family member 4 n=1 Tax=Danio aesculapii TaxID=1142201 RepID=UPI0024BFA5C6|nr:GTPase IMAP family member 4 [Danio aesculapii]
MAAGFSSKTTRDSPHLSEIRVVLLGNNECDRRRVVRSVLGDLTGDSVGHCTVYDGEESGRRIRVVDAPGWDSNTPQSNIRESIERSAALCAPGPHALLLVIPVRRSEEMSAGDVKSGMKLVEMLSERAWRHTIVVFACDEGTGGCSYSQKAKNMLEKCKGRGVYLQSHSGISQLFTQIEDLVQENGEDDVFLPQAYYELFRRKTEGLMHRRGNLTKKPLHMSKAEAGALGVEPFSVIVIAVLAALLVSFSFGAEYGVFGGCAGLVLGSILPF